MPSSTFSLSWAVTMIALYDSSRAGFRTVAQSVSRELVWHQPYELDG